MSSLVKLVRIPKFNKIILQTPKLPQRFISTSKKNQEVCVTDTEIKEQEQVNTFARNTVKYKIIT